MIKKEIQIVNTKKAFQYSDNLIKTVKENLIYILSFCVKTQIIQEWLLNFPHAFKFLMLHLYMKRGRKTLKKIIDLFVFYWFHRCYMERTYLSKCPVFFFFLKAM